MIAWDPFQVPGPISNPILDIGGESFLNGKDVWLAQPVVVVGNALECNMLGSVLVPPIQLLGLSIEGLQAQAVDVTLIIPLMSAGGRPSGGFAQWVWQHPGNGCREQSLQPGFCDLQQKNAFGQMQFVCLDWLGWRQWTCQMGWRRIISNPILLISALFPIVRVVGVNRMACQPWG